MMKRIILFDGVCNFCNWNIQFIIRHDPEARFLFAPLQSDAGQRLQQMHHISIDEDSIILFENGQYYTHSTAVVKIARQLSGMYPILYILIIIPKPIRDYLYRLIARNRYKWFGIRNRCMIPSNEERARFLQ